MSPEDRALTVRPISFHAARAWIATVHRHLSPPQGWVFGCQIVDAGGVRRGVGCAGRPVARRLDDGKTLEITRIAVEEGTPNGCSLLYGALRRAGQAIGYTRFVTYTLPDEPGTSLRAAGWREAGLTSGGEWSRRSRAREEAEQSGPKRRWLWP